MKASNDSKRALHVDCDCHADHGRHIFRQMAVIVACLLSWVAWDQVVRAQPQPTPDEVAAPAEVPPISVEMLDGLRKQVTESAQLDEETKQKLEATLSLAQEGLKRLAKIAGQAAQLKNDTQAVQQRVESLRNSLAELQVTKPSILDGLSLPELEQEVTKREVALAELKAELAKLEAEPSVRANRRKEIRGLLLSTTQRLAEIQQQLDTPPPTDESPLATAAREAELKVRRMLIEAELPALQNELAKYDAEDAVDLVRLERDVKTQAVSLASAELELLQDQLGRQRAADSAAAVQRAKDAAAQVPPSLKDAAEFNVSLAEAAHALTAPIQDIRLKLDKKKLRLESIEKQFLMTQERIKSIGLTGSVGAMLRRQRAELPNLSSLERNAEERKIIIEDIQYNLFEYNDLRSESLEDSLQGMLRGVESSGSIKERKQISAAAESLVEERRAYLDGVIRTYKTYSDALIELDIVEQLLVLETERYQDYIDERVLWIRSNRKLFSSFGLDASDSWAFDQARWLEVGELLVEDVRSYPLVYGIALVVFGALLWQKPRLRHELDECSQLASRGSCAEFDPTSRAAFCTLLLSITWPGLLLFLTWRMNIAADESQYARAISHAMLAVSLVYFPLELLRRVCRKRGLADSHFDWRTSTIVVIRRNLRWGTLPILISVFCTTLLYSSDPEHGLDSIERVSFIIGMLILAVFVRQVLRPESGIFHEYLKAHPGGWFGRLKLFWYGATVMIPLTLAAMTLWGYYYTAQQLTWRLYASFVFFVAMQLIRAFLQRLLLVQRRAISIQQARERRAAEAALREQTSESTQSAPTQLSTSQIVLTDEMVTDVAANMEQSRRLLRTGLVAVTLVGFWFIWVDVLPALRILDQWTVWTTTVTDIDIPSSPTSAFTTSSGSSSSGVPVDQTVEVLQTVTVADIGLAILIAILTFVSARNIPGLMEISILQKLPLDNSIRYALTRVTSYAIFLLGVILAFNAISVGWNKVQWLATALTFGLAFGLQEIFANFVAGLILLFERPLRVGDIVTVDDISGVVSRIRIRATTITNWDRKEYVIPNKEFITGRMLNWTLSDKTNRIVINVGIAYGSDVKRAKELVLETCRNHPLILKDPPTVVTFEGFGDNSLNLVVRTFLPDLDNRLPVIDELHTNIDLAFREAGIEIAFPQRDLHLRTVDTAVLNRLGQNSTTEKIASEGA